MTIQGIGLLAALFAAPALQTQELIGISWEGDILRIDPVTANATHIGSVSGIEFNSLSRDPQNRLFAVNHAAAEHPRLWRVDPVLGTVWPMHQVFLNDVRALAHSPDGKLYAIDQAGGSHSWLYELDLTVPPGSSAIKILIDEILFGTQGLTILGASFASDGTFYGWSDWLGLIEIDPLDATPTDVNGLFDGNNLIQSLAVAQDGTAIGGYENLYDVDLATGAMTLIGGPIGFGGVRGLEFLQDGPVPYCVGSLTSEFCIPTMTWTGSPSATAGSGFSVNGTKFPSNRPGLLYYSTSGPAAVAFGPGWRCVGAPIVRTQAQVSTGTAAQDCDGTLSFDFNAWIASGTDPQLTAGARVWCQYWVRDPPLNPPGQWALSDALQFDIDP